MLSNRQIARRRGAVQALVMRAAARGQGHLRALTRALAARPMAATQAEAIQAQARAEPLRKSSPEPLTRTAASASEARQPAAVATTRAAARRRG